MLWSCLVLPLYFAKSSLQVLSSWFTSQVYSTCTQSMMGLYHRSLNLNFTFPYFLLCSSVSPSVLEFGPSDLLSTLSILPLSTYCLLHSSISCFRLAGGISGYLNRRFGLDCPLLRKIEFPFATSPPKSNYPSRRRYHRHYHRRVKFLHHPRPKLFKPANQPSRLCRFNRQAVATASSLFHSVAGSIQLCSRFLLQLPGILVILAGLSHYFSTSFIVRAIATYLATCDVLASCYLAWCQRSRPFLHAFKFESDDTFGSELPSSSHEGELSIGEPSPVYSDAVESTLLDLFCCCMAQSRYNPSSSPSSEWESINPPPQHCFGIPELDSFMESIDPIADAVVLMKEEWHSISPRSGTIIDPVPYLEKFIPTIDPLLYFRVLNLDFSLSSSSPSLAYYNSDPMSQHVFLTKSEQSHLPIVIDTGASRSITPRREDFISFEKYSSKIEGIGSSTKVAGKGYVRWKITDQHDRTNEIVTFAYYIPSASIRLYSPQSHFAESKSGKLTCTWNEVRLYLPDASPIEVE